MMPSADLRRHRPGRPRAGMVLLEVIIALTILGVAGGSILLVTAESSASLRRAGAADAESRRASAFLSAVMLWPRADLDRHLGDRAEGAWRLRVDRPLATLYTVTLTDSTDRDTLLATSLYRPIDANAAP